MKLNKCRHLLACSCLVLFLGFGWFDSLRMFWDYFVFGSAPVATQSVEATQTVKDATVPASASQTAAPAGTSSGGPQCPGCAKPRPPRPPGGN